MEYLFFVLTNLRSVATGVAGMSAILILVCMAWFAANTDYASAGSWAKASRVLRASIIIAGVAALILVFIPTPDIMMR